MKEIKELKDAKSQVSEMQEIINSLQGKLGEHQQANSNLETKLFNLQRDLSEKESAEKSQIAQNEEFCKLFDDIKEENKLLKDQVSILEEKF